MTFPTYASLIKQRLLIPSPSVPYTAVENHFFSKILKNNIKTIPFDEEWYLTAYPDVAEAVKAEIVTDAHTHYVRFGYYEHRLPHPIAVDPVWYCAQYTDVQQAILSGAFPDAQAHFDRVGYREGRLPCPEFSE